MPTVFPTVNDAVLDYQVSVTCVVNEISMEYQRMFQGEEDNSSALGTTGQGAVKSAAGNMHHQRELREQKREKFLIEFNSSQLYSSLRQKLKKAIFRLAVEKYNKQVDHKGLVTKQQKEQFKAELYTFLQEQMKVFLNEAMDQHIDENNSKTQMHNDLIISYQLSKREA